MSEDEPGWREERENQGSRTAMYSSLCRSICWRLLSTNFSFPYESLFLFFVFNSWPVSKDDFRSAPGELFGLCIEVFSFLCAFWEKVQTSRWNHGKFCHSGQIWSVASTCLFCSLWILQEVARDFSTPTISLYTRERKREQVLAQSQ